ncbi:NHL repeat protein [Novipirellula aureliae]|uniref:NHL repeat protein n=1 Tax=Novipirellula aureliae TaxID=2527966 RepID=A0A5C6DF54_9BACT|nr:PEP-CTERM sorting domain-containing protein [Novipirellula aureliae]TWU35312.1 NHL repeat protein [Novipirellula aureliae]
MPTQTMRFLIGLLFVALLNTSSQAAILTTGYFSGTVEKFDEVTGAQTTFATFQPFTDGLSGIAYNPLNNRVYVSASNSGRIYMLNAQTGQDLGTFEVGVNGTSPLGGPAGPGGVAVGPTGNVYVTDLGANQVRVYDSNFTNLSNPGIITIPDPDELNIVTSGVGVDAGGNVYISTLENGIFRYDGVSVNSFNSNTLASAQIAIDASDNVYVGHGLAQASSVLEIDSLGNDSPFLTVAAADIGGAENGLGMSPSGVAIDENGDFIVAVLGNVNPFRDAEEIGGLLRYDSSGNLKDAIATNTAAFSSVTIVPSAVPEPSSFALLLTAVGVTSLFRRRRR